TGTAPLAWQGVWLFSLMYVSFGFAVRSVRSREAVPVFINRWHYWRYGWRVEFYLFHQPAKSLPGVCRNHASGVDRPLQIPEAVIFLKCRRVEVVTGRGFYSAAIGFRLGTLANLLYGPAGPAQSTSTE